MSLVIGILVGLLMLMLLVTAHEFGHFIMARKNGVEVEEFGICFPPRVVAWRKVDGKWKRIPRSQWKKMPGSGLIISLNLLPIGGFCQMKGESDADTRKGSFGAASYWRKTKILFGGVLMNWLVAFVIFTALAFVGMPHLMDDQFQIDKDTKTVVLQPVTISDVIADSPADKAGLKSGDEVLSARVITAEAREGADDYTTFVTTDDLLDFGARHRGETVAYNYRRDGKETMVKTTLNDKDADYALGASITGEALYMSTWSAPIVGAGVTLQMTGQTFKGMGKLVADLVVGAIKRVSTNAETREEGSESLKEAGDSVSGPVGIIGVLFPAVAQSGGRYLAYFVGIISVSLACMNVLPIPALDGGRWTLITIFRLRKKKLTKETEEKIVGKAFTGILIFAALVTLLDIIRIFRR